MNMKVGFQTMGVLRPNDAPSPEPVALETTVLVNGARPGDTGAKRQLFSEEVQTVLVFERGAVIRLSAAVTDGQLLFLTNKTTGKEVIAQVLRKRPFRPTSCYVDLEFTEACTGFWGIDFPKPGGASAAQKAAVADDSEGEPAKAATPPSLQEIDRLKQEIGALQNQLNSLQPAPPKEFAEPARPVLHNAVPPAAVPLPPTVAPAADAAKSAAQVAANVAKRDEERSLQDLLALAAQQEVPTGPKQFVSYPQKSAKVESASAKGNGKKVAALVFLLLAAGGVFAYQFGALDSFLKKPAPVKPAVAHPIAANPGVAKSPASNAMPAVKSPATNPPSANSATAAAASSNAAPGITATPGTSNATGSTSPAAGTANALTGSALGTATALTSSATTKPAGGNNSASAVAPAKEPEVAPALAMTTPSREATTSRASKRAPVATSSAAHRHLTTTPLKSTTTSMSTTPTNPPANDSAQVSASAIAPGDSATADPSGDYVGPKLIKAVKVVTPPDAMRNYVTGNVNVDAFVDSTGHVKSVTVLSGPAKLHATAIEGMKQYLYEPAKKNGKPVPSHVKVSLQYWYEP